MTDALRLVPFAPAHAAGVVELIGRVFEEYAMTFDVADFDADLGNIPTYYLSTGGVFAVLLDGDRVVGTVAALADGDACEIKRLYLARELRGRGHGRRLLQHVLDWAAARGCRRALAWSDARLGAAHTMYVRLGFVRTSERVLDDIDRSVEYGFARDLPARR